MTELPVRVIPTDRDPWVCEINGVKYSYPAGTEQSVPEKVAALIDAWEKHHEPKWAAPSGSGELVVTVNAVSTLDADVEPQYTASHTYAEIAKAFMAMKNVRVILVDGSGGFYNFILTGVWLPDAEAWFFNMDYPGWVMIGAEGVNVEKMK